MVANSTKPRCKHQAALAAVTHGRGAGIERPGVVKRRAVVRLESGLAVAALPMHPPIQKARSSASESAN
jgi:hypothetical protein